MGPYMSRSLGCYRCPADNYASYLGVRNRTVGMNSFVGDYIGLMVGKFGNTGYRVYNKLGDFTRPGPSMTFVLLDECPDSVNDGMFQVNMAANTWSDIVGSLHNGRLRRGGHVPAGCRVAAVDLDRGPLAKPAHRSGLGQRSP